MHSRVPRAEWLPVDASAIAAVVIGSPAAVGAEQAGAATGGRTDAHAPAIAADKAAGGCAAHGASSHLPASASVSIALCFSGALLASVD